MNDDAQAVAPTAELATHHDISAPERTRDRDQTAWAIKTRIAALYERSVLDDADMNACKRFREDWELGVEGARDPKPRIGKIDGDGGGLCFEDHQVAALSRLRAAEERLGGWAIGILRGIVVMDLAWSRMAVAIGVVDTFAAKRRCVACIKDLTAFWADFDRRKKAA